MKLNETNWFVEHILDLTLSRAATKFILECEATLVNRCLALNYIESTDNINQFALFLRYEILNNVLLKNIQAINESTVIDAVESVSGLFKDYEGYESILKEAKERRNKLEYKMEVTDEQLKEASSRYLMGYFPTPCYKDVLLYEDYMEESMKL